MIDLQTIKHLKVLMVGDAILDEYHYVAPLGKSIKENVISVRYEASEDFKGGVWAAARHLEDFVERVDVMCGNMVMHNAKYVDYVYNHKLFSVHRVTNGARSIHADIESYDCVIVCDFGHGLMNKLVRQDVMAKAKFLCVNCQTNSQNYGFNVITRKYDRADFVVLDELECRLAAHNKEGPIEEAIESLGFTKIIVTLGANGAIGWDGKDFYRAEAVADKVVDTMGCGDAFLAVASPYACVGLPMADLVAIGNAAGAVKAGILGHQRPVTREALERLL